MMGGAEDEDGIGGADCCAAGIRIGVRGDGTEGDACVEDGTAGLTEGGDFFASFLLGGVGTGRGGMNNAGSVPSILVGMVSVVILAGDCGADVEFAPIFPVFFGSCARRARAMGGFTTAAFWDGEAADLGTGGAMGCDVGGLGGFTTSCSVVATVLVLVLVLRFVGDAVSFADSASFDFPFVDFGTWNSSSSSSLLLRLVALLGVCEVAAGTSPFPSPLS
jgi:hypothetical protein